jgi:hypothetical protein
LCGSINLHVAAISRWASKAVDAGGQWAGKISVQLPHPGIRPANHGELLRPIHGGAGSVRCGNVSLGSVTLVGNTVSNPDDSAIFIGILSSAADIQSILVKVPVTTNLPQDFLINGPRIQTGGAVVPEPASMALAGAALLALGGLRRKLGRRTVTPYFAFADARASELSRARQARSGHFRRQRTYGYSVTGRCIGLRTV